MILNNDVLITLISYNIDVKSLSLLHALHKKRSRAAEWFNCRLEKGQGRRFCSLKDCSAQVVKMHSIKFSKL